MVGEIQVKELTPQLVFGWRGKVRISEMPAKMGELYGRIFPYLMSQQAGFAGPPLTIYYEMPQGDEPLEIEVAVPVTGDVSPLDGLATHTLAGGEAAVTIFKGPYERIGEAYDELMGWVDRHGYEVSGPPREAYLNGPDEVKDLSELQTEVVFPVRKAAA